jgi:hypothetical protein
MLLTSPAKTIYPFINSKKFRNGPRALAVDPHILQGYLILPVKTGTIFNADLCFQLNVPESFSGTGGSRLKLKWTAKLLHGQDIGEKYEEFIVEKGSDDLIIKNIGFDDTADNDTILICVLGVNEQALATTDLSNQLTLVYLSIREG